MKEFTREGGEAMCDVQAGLWVHRPDDAQMEVKVAEHGSSSGLSGGEGTMLLWNPRPSCTRAFRLGSWPPGSFGKAPCDVESLFALFRVAFAPVPCVAPGTG